MGIERAKARKKETERNEGQRGGASGGGGGKEGGAHLHAEPQSDCGAHRQLARVLFLRSSTGARHWDSARKVKTDFSRSASASSYQ